MIDSDYKLDRYCVEIGEEIAREIAEDGGIYHQQIGLRRLMSGTQPQELTQYSLNLMMQTTK